MKNKKALICMGILALWLVGLVFPTALPANEKLGEMSEYGNPFTWVTVGKVKVKAEVVGTPEKLYLGLGKRPSLPEGQGMLFVMPQRQIQVFCMRDMRFALDFIWLAPGRVAGLTRNVSPRDQEACYRSPEPVNYVLEVPAGFCDRHGIKVGDKAAWK
ncbi:MAG: DUF192 domain-containing protein [Deltaproteobacteria bacterium]|nr:DUF192 domain-containing protein [Deltaproteobacteria bacterium]